MFINTYVVASDIYKTVKKMYYTERLQWIRDCKNITQKELAEHLGIKQQQYARYEKGINIMPITYLPKICEYLDVSADYILDLTDDMIRIRKIRLKSFNFSFSLIYFVFNVYSLNNK